MMQQINLYQEELRAIKARFSAHTLLVNCGVMTGAIVLIVGYGLWRIYGLGDEINALKFAHSQAEQQLSRVRAELAARAIDPEIGARITELETLLAQRNQLRALLERDDRPADQLNSDYFVALARGHIPGLWLTEIRIGGGARQLRIKGRATDPEHVPRYLEALSREPVFSGSRFTVFQIDQAKNPEQAGSALEFTLATAGMDGSAP